MTINNTAPQNDSVTRAIVTGKVVMNDGTTGYHLLKYRHSADPEHHWSYISELVSESQLYSLIARGSIPITNVGIKSGRLIGTTGDLNRFKLGENSAVILSIMLKNNSTIIGYRIATCQGIVRALKIDDILDYCRETTKVGKIPFQNAIYVPSTTGIVEHLRAYKDGEFLVENYTRNKSVAASKVDTQEAKKALSKDLTEIYTKEQLEQLIEGKKNGTNIKVFANPALSAEQMEALRYAMEKYKVNPRSYASPEFRVGVMRFLSSDQMCGFDISNYTLPTISYDRLALLSYATAIGLDSKALAELDITDKALGKEIERAELSLFDTIQTVTGVFGPI